MTIEQIQAAGLSDELQSTLINILTAANKNKGTKGVKQSFGQILLHLTQLFPEEKRNLQVLFNEAARSKPRRRGTPKKDASSFFAQPGTVQGGCADCPGGQKEVKKESKGLKVQPLGGVTTTEEEEVTVPAHLYEEGELEEQGIEQGQEQTEEPKPTTPEIKPEELTNESTVEDVLIAHGKGIITDTEVAEQLRATMSGLGIEYSARAKKLETLAGYYLDHLKAVGE